MTLIKKTPGIGILFETNARKLLYQGKIRDGKT